MTSAKSRETAAKYRMTTAKYRITAAKKGITAAIQGTTAAQKEKDPVKKERKKKVSVTSMRRCDIGPGRPRVGSFLQCCIVIVHRAEGDVGDGTTVAGTIGCYRFSASAPLSIKYTFRQQRFTIT